MTYVGVIVRNHPTRTTQRHVVVSHKTIYVKKTSATDQKNCYIDTKFYYTIKDSFHFTYVDICLPSLAVRSGITIDSGGIYRGRLFIQKEVVCVVLARWWHWSNIGQHSLSILNVAVGYICYHPMNNGGMALAYVGINANQSIRISWQYIKEASINYNTQQLDVNRSRVIYLIVFYAFYAVRQHESTL